ncbi:hypothetical protein DER46DRAFT_611498 [Fusarium sp. MPI-SDFR-AT-0072]|nr:hypothetical protein DER46DRAFT_611498 [Fusarium sp. MPI-SDFR-AT-0072]KAH7186691.1 hypothetical protein DER44DRAFT_801955 [Fusarium oxysporum]
MSPPPCLIFWVMICGTLGYLLLYEYGLARFSYKYAKGGVKVDEIERVHRILSRQQSFNSRPGVCNGFIQRSGN